MAGYVPPEPPIYRRRSGVSEAVAGGGGITDSPASQYPMAIDLPPIGLGTFRNTDPEQCAQSVQTALEAGYRHVDTAELYENEAAVGDGLAAADIPREDVFVSTKVDSRNLGYDEVLETAATSREKLGVDTIDLLYVHWPIRTYDPEETLAAFDELYDRGDIRHVGLSNFLPAQLLDAMNRLDAPVYAHQVECHPFLQQAELRQLAREHGHHLVAYSPLAKGDVVDAPEIQSVADRVDATPAQVALAWLLSKESVSVIPKATGEAHIRENLGALDVDLDPEDIATIDGIEREQRYVDFDAAPWNQ